MGVVRVRIVTLSGEQAKAVKYLYEKYDAALGFDERVEDGKMVIDITMDKFTPRDSEKLEIRDVQYQIFGEKCNSNGIGE